MNKPVITRFAPSPTGYLHVGGARTALFSWLYAHHHGGQFILRIEDTDLERSTEESIQAILESMQWLDLNYDHDQPYYQTQHFDRYREIVQKLLTSGHAYKCYCTKDRLETLREEQNANKKKPRYDGYCRDLTEEKNLPYVIRFHNPLTGQVSFCDRVRGTITVNNSELDDLIIQRTDGAPTYNFTVVVDDWDMKITHVIRGDDHINNTPRQINIFKALGAEPPQYAHVPMILGQDGKRLSKRHGVVSVMEYCDLGILPQALLNYLVRLGWSRGDQEIFSREEMIRYFDLQHINHAPAAFNQEKLLWLNQHYIKTLPTEMLITPLSEQFAKLDIALTLGPTLTDIIALQADRVKTLKEMAEQSVYFYQDVEIPKEVAEKYFNREILPVLQQTHDELHKLRDWNKEVIHFAITQIADVHGLKLGKVAPPIRVAVTGGSVSPSLDATLQWIGKERVLDRLKRAIDWIQSNFQDKIAAS